MITALNDIFPESEIKDIMEKAVGAENKKVVIERTKESQAFGAPWIVAVNGKGEKRMWFGNDRWDQVFDHLEVPYKPVSIIPPSSSKL